MYAIVVVIGVVVFLTVVGAVLLAVEMHRHSMSGVLAKVDELEREVRADIQRGRREGAG